MAKAKRTGTASSDDHRRRGRQVTLRVADGEFEAFKQMAESLDLPLTTWIRLVCRRAAGMQTP